MEYSGKAEASRTIHGKSASSQYPYKAPGYISYVEVQTMRHKDGLAMLHEAIAGAATRASHVAF